MYSPTKTWFQASEQGIYIVSGIEDNKLCINVCAHTTKAKVDCIMNFIVNNIKKMLNKLRQ
jgi:hypothetical protein